MAKVAAFVPDLLFGSRVVSRLTAGGHEASLAADEEALRAWLAEGYAGPRAIVADLTAEAPGRVEVLGRLRTEGVLDGVKLAAFYSHVDSDVRTLAEQSSFDLIVARSRYAREGAALVTRLFETPDEAAPGDAAPADEPEPKPAPATDAERAEESAPDATPVRRPGGRVALITGASSGIGEATARRLARDGGWTLVLVARREERLQALASELGGATVVAVDLTGDDAPARVRAVLEREHGGRLDLLVNNAGAGYGGSFASNGYAEVRRTMALNFDAVVRLCEELLPLLRRCAPSALVNVASTAGRVGRAKSGAYSASKFALAGWTDSLHLEEKRNGVHVGLVLPGFVATEGFPQRALVDKPTTRWLVSTADKVADAIVDAGPGGKAERYVPRPYALAAALRVVAPGLVRWALSRWTRGLARGGVRRLRGRCHDGGVVASVALRQRAERAAGREQLLLDRLVLLFERGAVKALERGLQVGEAALRVDLRLLVPAQDRGDGRLRDARVLGEAGARRGEDDPRRAVAAGRVDERHHADQSRVGREAVGVDRDEVGSASEQRADALVGPLGRRTVSCTPSAPSKSRCAAAAIGASYACGGPSRTIVASTSGRSSPTVPQPASASAATAATVASGRRRTMRRGRMAGRVPSRRSRRMERCPIWHVSTAACSPLGRRWPSAPGATIRSAGDADAAVFPHGPAREVFNNALLRTGAADVAGTLQALETVYAAAGVGQFALWVHESRRDALAVAAGAGWRETESTRAMAADPRRRAGTRVGVERLAEPAELFLLNGAGADLLDGWPPGARLRRPRRRRAGAVGRDGDAPRRRLRDRLRRDRCGGASARARATGARRAAERRRRCRLHDGDPTRRRGRAASTRPLASATSGAWSS